MLAFLPSTMKSLEGESPEIPADSVDVPTQLHTSSSPGCLWYRFPPFSYACLDGSCCCCESIFWESTGSCPMPRGIFRQARSWRNLPPHGSARRISAKELCPSLSDTVIRKCQHGKRQACRRRPRYVVDLLLTFNAMSFIALCTGPSKRPTRYHTLPVHPLLRHRSHGLVSCSPRRAQA